MEDKTKEIFWYTMLFLTIIACFIIIFHIIFSDKPIRGYYLGSNDYGSMGLYLDIDNYPDNKITLNGISYQEAIKIVDSLNAGLKKIKH